MSRALVVLLALALPASAAVPPGLAIEEQPKDPTHAKIVLVAGSNFYKPGEHDYVAGCAVLADLLRRTPNVAPVIALDWPKKPETLAGAKAVVLFTDGAEKHEALKGNRLADLQKLADAGAGLVLLHQTIDVPKDLGDLFRGLAGAAWEKGYSQRAHWTHEFDTFPNHPICRGVTPFTINDGWLYQQRFAEGMKGVTPLLRTVGPKSDIKPTDDAAVVAWAFERPKGRTFVFTGGHLHHSLAQEGYRRFLVNGILWSAGLDIPADGAPVPLTQEILVKYLTPDPKK